MKYVDNDIPKFKKITITNRLWTYFKIDICQGILCYIIRSIIWLRIPFNVKLQEIDLDLIGCKADLKFLPDERFNLGGTSYPWDKLYTSLLKSNGLNPKYTPPILYKIYWDGTQRNHRVWLGKGFVYGAWDGNHRIAALKFMEINNLTSSKVKVLVSSYKFLRLLSNYNLADKFKKRYDY